jgi:hypothetical protein
LGLLQSGDENHRRADVFEDFYGSLFRLHEIPPGGVMARSLVAL